MRSLLCVLALAGCTTSAVAIEDYQGKLREARCQYQTRCGLFPDVQSCLLFFPLGSFGSTVSLIAAVDAGKSTYDGNKAAQCINETSNADCNVTTREGREVPPSCLQVVHGTGAMGEACASNSECDSAACMTPSCGMACCIGTCGPARVDATVGEPCATRQCATGLTCDNTKTCVELFGTGTPCNDGSQCGYGLACAGVPGTCQVAPNLGEACPDQTCAQLNAVCAGDTCIQLGLPGAACNPFLPCSQFYKCVSGTCAVQPTMGQPCTNLCSDGSWCNVPSGMTSGNCEPPRVDGSSCTANDQCESYSCDGAPGPGMCKPVAVCI